ncbi:MAG: hypothetical protein LBQ88_04205 [Treponema sp.]|jgi:GTP cyclohydrolase II|nr:hypothetical protein [Treponema sp.]
MNPLLVKLASGPFPTELGDFTIAEFTDGKDHAIAVYKGDITNGESILCRIHSECLSSYFRYTGCDCANQLENAERDIERDGRGIIIYLMQEGRSNGSAAHIASLSLKAQGMDQVAAYRELGFSEDKRDFDMAVKILQYFNIKSVKLETGNKAKISTLEKFGISVKPEDYSDCVIDIRRIDNIRAYEAIGQNLGVLIKNTKGKGKWVFIIGDLNVDYKIELGSLNHQIINRSKPAIGGTAYNAAKEFRDMFEPIVFGKVGNDFMGNHIKQQLKEDKITALLDTAMDKATGFCTLLYHGNERWLIKDDQETNANDYDLKNLEKALAISKIDEKDYIFIIGHALIRCGINHTSKLIEQAASTGAHIILDLVPHNMYESVGLAELKSAIKQNIEILIGEFKTLMGFFGISHQGESPTMDEVKAIFQNIPVKIIDIRYGIGNISKQIICERSADGKKVFISEEESTGYEFCPIDKRSGFGDQLTATLIAKYDEGGGEVFIEKVSADILEEFGDDHTFLKIKDEIYL